METDSKETNLALLSKPWHVIFRDHSGPTWGLDRQDNIAPILVQPSQEQLQNSHDVRLELFASENSSLPLAFLDTFRDSSTEKRMLSLIWAHNVQSDAMFSAMTEFLIKSKEQPDEAVEITMDAVNDTWEGKLDGSEQDKMEHLGWAEILKSNSPLVGIIAENQKICLMADFEAAVNGEAQEFLMFWPADMPLPQDQFNQLVKMNPPQNMPFDTDSFVKVISEAIRLVNGAAPNPT